MGTACPCAVGHRGDHRTCPRPPRFPPSPNALSGYLLGVQTGEVVTNVTTRKFIGLPEPAAADRWGVPPGWIIRPNTQGGAIDAGYEMAGARYQGPRRSFRSAGVTSPARTRPRALGRGEDGAAVGVDNADRR